VLAGRDYLDLVLCQHNLSQNPRETICVSLECEDLGM